MRNNLRGIGYHNTIVIWGYGDGHMKPSFSDISLSPWGSLFVYTGPLNVIWKIPMPQYFPLGESINFGFLVYK